VREGSFEALYLLSPCVWTPQCRYGPHNFCRIHKSLRVTQACYSKRVKIRSHPAVTLSTSDQTRARDRHRVVACRIAPSAANPPNFMWLACQRAWRATWPLQRQARPEMNHRGWYPNRRLPWPAHALNRLDRKTGSMAILFRATDRVHKTRLPREICGRDPG
jgi:hypothetical protein